MEQRTMIYEVKVEHYEEWDEKMVKSSMFVYADTIVEAVQQASNYYGEKCLESIEVRPFSPDNFLVFEEENTDLFTTVRDTLEREVVW